MEAARKIHVSGAACVSPCLPCPVGVVRFCSKTLPHRPPTSIFHNPQAGKKFLKHKNESIAAVREFLLPGLNDAKMHETWRLLQGDKEVMALPREKFLRDVMLNHWYQHRGQF